MSKNLKSKTLEPNALANGAREHSLISRSSDGSEQTLTDQIAEEKAVAMVYNGISHAVMMATPLDLEDFARGFSLTEGIVEAAEQIRAIDVVESELGFEVQMEIASASFMQLKHRRRQLSGRTGCGICGLESLQTVKPKVNKVPVAKLPSYQAIEKALQQMQKKQDVQSRCGAVHAASYVSMDGEVLVLREDVGRHNALDKLIGAIAEQNPAKSQATEKSQITEKGFVLVSSRASFEMVAKTASQFIPTLVSVSAPTTMAIGLAEEAEMNLIGFVRPNKQLVYCQSGQ